MILIGDSIPSFDEFACDDSRILEMYINERGETIPPDEWRKTAVHMRNVNTGLNMGKDREETLYKYTDKSGEHGPIARMNLAIPVQIDQVSHAAEQMYRWEHRFDQVDQAEILKDVTTAAPKLAELVLNGGIVPGKPFNRDDRGNKDYGGMVWLYNVESGLNIIVQVKGKEQRDHAFKITIVTVLRKRGMEKWSKDMPKVTVSSTEARIVYVPSKTTA